MVDKSKQRGPPQTAMYNIKVGGNLLSVLFIPQRKATEKVKKKVKEKEKVLSIRVSDKFNYLTALTLNLSHFLVLLNVSITSFMLLFCPALK